MALTDKDVRIVFGMVARGDKHHDVAAWFGENPARIAEVLAGERGWPGPAPAEELPPKGAAGPKGRRMRAFAAKALKALEGGDANEAAKVLKDGLAAYDKNEA